MSKLQRNRVDILGELNERLVACDMSPKELATNCNIDYYAAWRYLRPPRQARNLNKSALALCDYFCVSIEVEESAKQQMMEKMNRAICSSWDGSRSQAELIVRLIRAAKR